MDNFLPTGLNQSSNGHQSLPSLIKDKMKQKKIKPIKLCNEIGMHHSCFSRFINGQSKNIASTSLIKMLIILDISLGELKSLN